MGVEDYNKKQLERLREHKIAFDQEAMWAAMQKKKRRGAFFFFTMALVALAIVFFTWCLFSIYNGENITNKGENSWFKSEKTSVSNLSNKTNIENEGKNGANSNEIANVESDNNKISDVTETKLNASDEASELKKSTYKSENSKEDGFETEKAANASKRENVKKKLANIYASSTVNGTSKTIKNSSQSKYQNTQSIDSVITTTDNSASNNQTTPTANVLINQNSGSEKKSYEGENSILDNLLNIQPLKVYEFPYLKSLENLPKDLDELEVKAPLITEVIKEPKSRFHIGAYGGVGYLFRQATIENETLEEESEKLEEVSAGLELKYQLTPNFFVRSGLEYWQATERFELSTYSISNAKDLPNNIVMMEEGIIINTTYSKIHTIYKSYNIPIVLGWNTNNTKWNVFAEAGLLYNFKTDRKRDDSFVNTEQDRYNVGSQNKISPIAGVGLSFSPTNKIELYARSNWRGSQSVTLEETQASLKFAAIRTQIGMRIGI